MVSLCLTNSPTSRLGQAPSQLREVALQRTTVKRVEPFESYLAPSFCILLHTTSIEFSCTLDPRTSLGHPNQVQRFHACNLAFLHWNNLIHIFGMYPINLFTSRSQHKIFWQISTVDSIPESPSFFQDLIIFQRDFWCRACNFLNCIQLVILFQLFTQRLQNRCNQFWRMRVQQRSLHLRIHSVSPNFPLPALPSSSPRLFLILQLFVKKPVVFRTCSLDSDRIFFTFLLHTSLFTKYVVDSVVNFLIVGSLHDACPPGCSCSQ